MQRLRRGRLPCEIEASLRVRLHGEGEFDEAMRALSGPVATPSRQVS